ncbi:RidA family protein [Vibrio nitrifigilis]|uniref:RidA family protein n=1 Tax=Vibrio nitrifigilis TaxID=2789781 RepID=A0ABS0GLK0_9VIBR|nr:RidA family protein [Vibrio nitrifigilis]MBF9003307.1 RidA family protein [Vibrio nitrifigilis]
MSSMPALPFSKVRRIGQTVYLSGEIGFNDDGSIPVTIEEQTHQCFARIQTTLEAEGLDLSHVVSATCYLTDTDDFTAFNSVYADYFQAPLPVRTTIKCELMVDAKVEITVIAMD